MLERRSNGVMEEEGGEDCGAGTGDGRGKMNEPVDSRPWGYGGRGARLLTYHGQFDFFLRLADARHPSPS